jgi:aryl-alcohol dehydrogenase-like predicted oxidoreductase
MINRREFFGISAAAGATLALTPELLRALQQTQGQLIQRAIPSSGEMLPVIGLSRGNVPADHAALKEVFQALVDNGGRLLDTVHGWDSADQVAAAIASELRIQDRIFWSAQLRPAPGPPGSNDDPAAVARAQVEASFARLRVPRIDLLQVSVLRPDLATSLAVLREMKRQGRVRYIGVTAAFPNQHAAVESVMRNEPIDFISVDYAIDNRAVEATILPLAQERRIGVLAYFPFGGGASREDGTPVVVNRLFQRAGTTPLPDWAAEFDATSWAQFFLKYVVSHPAVTAVRVGTTRASHMVDNIGGGIGRLPNDAMRKRMAEFVDALPEAREPQGPQGPAGPAVVVPAAVLDRYVGEFRTATGLVLTFRRDGARLFAKVGANPELPLTAQSETRFSAGPFVLEFVPPDGGTVTDLIIHQGNQRTPATRTR